MAIRITLECGHASLLRTRTTPEGYTHDWEVFVRGVDNADISQYVDKVIFQLHETFPKPKRVLKEAPYVVKESGYAGFVIPIDIYLKNKDEPKKIQIMYDLTLQHSGPPLTNIIKHSEIITNPAEDFRRKLLKGGGITVSNTEEGNDKSESKVSVQMVGKPKLSGTETKKHRPIEPRSTNQFAHLFGVPIKTGNKVSPENKKSQEKANYHNKAPVEKTEKIDKSSKSKTSPHKDSKKEKTDEKKEKREKEPVKEKDRSKEKVKRPQSPGQKNEYHSPIPKRPQSPQSKKQLSPHDSNIQKSSSPKIREKEHKKLMSERDKHIDKPKETSIKPPEDLKIDKKKKKHKDDKEQSDRKEKNREKERDKTKETKPPAVEKKSEKHEKSEKQDKDKLQENRPQKDDKKSPKIMKDCERSTGKNRPEKSDIEKQKEQKSEKERQKHKHRKKDKKERSDDSREREKRDKREKQKTTYEKESTPTSVPAVNPLSTLLAEVQDRDSSDSVNSGDEDDQKQMISNKNDADSNRLIPDIRLTRPISPSAASSGKNKNEKPKKDKSKQSRTSDDREGKKRKRRSDSKGDDELPIKRDKEPGFSPPIEPVSSSQSPVAVEITTNYSNNSVKEQDDDINNKEAFETEQIAPDSTNNILVESENDEPLVFSDDYVSQLKDLQHKIMTLQDNQELQRVVQVIAATGQYEITRKTFDFDLCALDRRTVQRLQEFFSAS